MNWHQFITVFSQGDTEVDRQIDNNGLCLNSSFQINNYTVIYIKQKCINRKKENQQQ